MPRFGTTQRNPMTGRVMPGEVNQYGRPIGTGGGGDYGQDRFGGSNPAPAPGQTPGHDWGAFNSAFGPQKPAWVTAAQQAPGAGMAGAIAPTAAPAASLRDNPADVVAARKLEMSATPITPAADPNRPAAAVAPTAKPGSLDWMGQRIDQTGAQMKGIDYDRAQRFQGQLNGSTAGSATPSWASLPVGSSRVLGTAGYVGPTSSPDNDAAVASAAGTGKTVQTPWGSVASNATPGTGNAVALAKNIAGRFMWNPPAGGATPQTGVTPAGMGANQAGGGASGLAPAGARPTAADTQMVLPAGVHISPAAQIGDAPKPPPTTSPFAAPTGLPAPKVPGIPMPKPWHQVTQNDAMTPQQVQNQLRLGDPTYDPTSATSAFPRPQKPATPLDGFTTSSTSMLDPNAADDWRKRAGLSGGPRGFSPDSGAVAGN